MRKVLLVNPHDTAQSGYTNPPIGLLYLAGSLLQEGAEVEVVDGCRQGKAAIEEALARFRPDVVGAVCLTPARHKAFEVARIAKAFDPGIEVVLGGAHATIMYQQILENYPEVDLVVLGEGERSMVEICRGDDPAKIAGIAYRDGLEVRKTRPRRQVENLDDLPFPAWHLCDLRRYEARGEGVFRGIDLAREPRVSVVFSRGCKGHCDFCSTWWIWRGWRHRSPRNMVDELQLLHDTQGIRHFCFADDALTIDRDATIGLCDEILSRGLKIAFHATTRTDCVDREVLEKLAAAGCYGIAYGIETGSEKLLQGMNKENDVENAVRAMDLTRAAGIRSTALIIAGNIGETPETIKDTIRLLQRGNPDEVGCVGALWVLPGTKVYRECVERGHIDDGFWLGGEPYMVYDKEWPVETLNVMAAAIQNFRGIRLDPEPLPPLRGGSVATVVNFCTLDQRFIADCVHQALEFSERVAVVAFDHLLDGTGEDMELLRRIERELSGERVRFVLAPYDHATTLALGSRHWHNAARWIGAEAVGTQADHILFLDADEIVEGRAFRDWYGSGAHAGREAISLACHWYFREPGFQALTPEFAGLLVRRQAVRKELFFSDRERWAFLDLPNSARCATGLDGRPMVHHYSWVRSREEMLAKVKAWGHNKDRDWTSLVRKEFSHGFEGTDFVHGYSYRTVEPPFPLVGFDGAHRADPRRDLLAQADSLCAQGRLEDALSLVSRDSSHPEFLRRTGSILFSLGRPSEAAAQFHRLAALLPEDIDAQASLAALSLLRGDMERAATHLERILERDPLHVESLFGMLRVRAEQKDAAGVAAFGRRFLSSAPDDQRAAEVRLLVDGWSAVTVASIVVPVHGHLDLTRLCVEAVRSTTDPSVTEIVIVDDASPDGTAAWLREQEKAGVLKAVFLEENQGFAKACNAGAAASSGSSLVFLNNDAIARPGWLQALLAPLSGPAIGLVGARLLYPEGDIQHAGIRMRPDGFPYHEFRHAAADDPRALESRDRAFVTGACIALSRELFARVGGFDEGFRMYVEDLDLCLKVWDAGLRVRYAADCVLVHLESLSTPDQEKRDAQVRAGMERLLSRWNGKWPAGLLGLADWPDTLRPQVPSDTACAPVGNAVHWITPVWDPSGYGTLGRSFMENLSRSGLALSATPWGRRSETFRQAASEAQRETLDGILERSCPPGAPVVAAIPVSALGRAPGKSGHHVGFSMFETDSLPADWVRRCNSMDEIWVPSTFNADTFRRAGVEKPVFTMPLGVDTTRFRPGLEPLPLPGGSAATTFLSVFEWTHRKGWDVLLGAWAEAFGPGDDVRLVLRAYPANAVEGDPGPWVEERIEGFLASLGKRREDCAPIEVLGRQIPEQDMPRLYAAADVYLAPSRGEGWGLPHMEAMSCGLPVVATGWSGNLDFQDHNNSWLIEIDGLEEIDEREEFEFYRGQKWARPSATHLVELLRQAAASPELRAAKGRRARADMESRWDWSLVARRAETRLREILAGVSASESVLAEVRTAPSVRVAAQTGDAPRPAIRWAGQVFNFSGYARLAREALAGLDLIGSRVTCDPQLNDPEYFQSLKGQPRQIARWKELLSRTPEPGTLVVCDIPRDTRGADVVQALALANPGCERKVCWTMFESDRLPDGWADTLNGLDEVWVPSEFNRSTFSRAGVDQNRIHVVPGCIDTTPYASAAPMDLPGRGYAFLSVFQWIRRKGWDVLVDAWAKAFKPDEGVRLVLKSHAFGDAQPVSEQLRLHLASKGLRREDLAPIHLIEEFLPDDRLPALYSACDCFVLPTRGEGWGLPFLEAMAAAKPVIGTRWGASTDFLREDNAWLLDPREPVLVPTHARSEVPYFGPDHRWADPDPDQLAAVLRHAFEHPEEGRAKGRKGLAEARNWSPRRTAEAIERRLASADASTGHIHGNPAASRHVLSSVAGGKLSSALEKVASGLRSRSGRSTEAQPSPSGVSSTAPAGAAGSSAILSVRWEGSQFVHHSLAHVNREICLRLARFGHDLSLVPWEPDQFGSDDDPDLRILETLKNAPLEGPCQVHVRHQWPPVLQAPSQGRWVVVQPWEFGSPPKDWIPAFRDQVDEIWAYTRYVKRVYVEAGIPEGKIRVVPLGVDTDRFRPGLAPLPGLERDGRLTFLYVGGTIARKGFDVLLNAWRAAFSASDPVRLVVKDMGGESFYKGQTGETMVRELNKAGTSAPVVYVDRDLTPADLPRIYASGDVLVHPYRGEGFGLPIAEAMASGLPAVITRGGAADDFCGPDESWGVSARRVPVPGGRVGPFETVAEPWWLEPSAEELSSILREVADDVEGRRRKGAAARQRILSGWTWDHAARKVESALRELAQRADAPRRDAPKRDLDGLNKLLFRAEAAVARGDLVLAEPATRAAVDEFPDQPLAWLARSMVLRGLGNISGASVAVEKALDLQESPEALLESVQIHRLTGQGIRAKMSEQKLRKNHGAWLSATRALYESNGQRWPLDPPRRNNSAKKTAAPPVRKRR